MSENIRYEPILAIAMVPGLLSYEAHLYITSYTYLSVVFISLMGFCAWLMGGKISSSGLDARIMALLGCIAICQIVVAILTGDNRSACRPIVLPLLVCVVLSIYRNYSRFITYFVFGVAACAVISCLEQADIINWWNFIALRNSSVFMDPNYAGTLFGLGAICCLAYTDIKMRRVLLLLLVIGMTLTYSRGAIVSFVTAWGAWLICERSRRLLVPCLILILVVAAVLIALDPSLFIMRAFHGSSGRADMWAYALRFVFEENNYFGVGVGGLQGVMRAGGFSHSSTHNFLLDSMIEYGVAYVLLLFTLLAYALWRGFRDNVRQFPVLVFLFVSSNFIVISVGGIGLLSFMYISAVLICASHIRAPSPPLLSAADDAAEPVIPSGIQ